MKIKIILPVLFLLFFQFIGDCFAQSKISDFKDLIGRWVRPDGGYTLVIKKVNDEGNMVAKYTNPNNINVAKAKASIESGKINLFVELQDVGYPGSYYTLVYDPDKDRLVGVYHRMVVEKKFDIFFVRE
jgi:uncharacterized protein (DUF2147 family)